MAMAEEISGPVMEVEQAEDLAVGEASEYSDVELSVLEIVGAEMQAVIESEAFAAGKIEYVDGVIYERKRAFEDGDEERKLRLNGRDSRPSRKVPNYSAKCRVQGCIKHASFGFPGDRKLRCSQHIVQGMVNLKHAKRRLEKCKSEHCQAENCNKYASFGWPNSPRVRCGTHMLLGMVDRKHGNRRRKTARRKGVRSNLRPVVGSSSVLPPVVGERALAATSAAYGTGGGSSTLVQVGSPQLPGVPPCAQGLLSQQGLSAASFRDAPATSSFELPLGEFPPANSRLASLESPYDATEAAIPVSVPGLSQAAIPLERAEYGQIGLEAADVARAQLEREKMQMQQGGVEEEEVHEGLMEMRTSDADVSMNDEEWDIEDDLPSSPTHSCEDRQQASNAAESLNADEMSSRLVDPLTLVPCMSDTSLLIQKEHQQNQTDPEQNTASRQPDCAFSLSSNQDSLPPAPASWLDIQMLRFRARATHVCAERGCSKMGLFNYPGEPRYCDEHRADGMELPKCTHQDCKYMPYFGEPREHAPTRCKRHREEGMVDKRGTHPSHRCSAQNCPTIANFNYPGGLGRWCSHHKLEGMVNVKEKRRCVEEGCGVRPYFGYPDDYRASFCFEHKVPDMTDIRNGKCEFQGCQKIPGYGYPLPPGPRARTKLDPPKMVRCSKHKLDGMVALKNPRCKVPDCAKQAVFGYPGERVCRCFQHQLEGMVSPGGLAPVCTGGDCGEIAKWGFEWEERASRCRFHKVDGMVPWSWALNGTEDEQQRSSLESTGVGGTQRRYLEGGEEIESQGEGMPQMAMPGLTEHQEDLELVSSPSDCPEISGHLSGSSPSREDCTYTQASTANDYDDGDESESLCDDAEGGLTAEGVLTANAWGLPSVWK